MIHTEAELQEFVSRVALPAGWTLKAKTYGRLIDGEPRTILDLDLMCSPPVYGDRGWVAESVVWSTSQAVAPRDGMELLKPLIERSFVELAKRVTFDGKPLASLEYGAVTFQEPA